MSGIGPDTDGDDSDLKECLLETLKADGTLKQIQDQLSAAVYAAFYRQTAQPVERTPSPLNTLISKQNVDFLQSLGLNKTLNVLMHETGLGEFKPEPRDSLLQRYNLSVSDKTPVLPALLDAFADLLTVPQQLSKAVILDQDSDNGLDKPFCNNGSVTGNLGGNFSPPPGISATSKDQRQRRSPPHLVDSTKKIGDFSREQAGCHDNDKTLSSGVHQSQQQFQWSSRRDLEKEGDYAITTDPTDDRSAYTADDALSGSFTGDHLQETPRCQHVASFANTATGGSPSFHAVYPNLRHSVIQPMSPMVTPTLIPRPQQADFAHSLASCRYQ
ncbi:hypothetical protein TcWFU_000113 [Taenia crassiceps]|uniref:Uncharacterized protein n=1 Tax=Taenia crassiceps TaxID=6207 RepID=A0ABR4QBU1_9CEST